jgi:hypothetical protein
MEHATSDKQRQRGSERRLANRRPGRPDSRQRARNSLHYAPVDVFGPARTSRTHSEATDRVRPERFRPQRLRRSQPRSARLSTVHLPPLTGGPVERGPTWLPLSRTTGRLNAGARAVVYFSFSFTRRRSSSGSLTTRSATEQESRQTAGSLALDRSGSQRRPRLIGSSTGAWVVRPDPRGRPQARRQVGR